MPIRDPEERREYHRKWIARRREDFFRDKVCVNCGSTDRLELDHVDPSRKIEHRIWSWSEERRTAEIAKCQVLCRACHERKSVEERDYKPAPHGTMARYKYKLDPCRCKLCTEANAAYEHKRRKQGQDRIVRKYVAAIERGLKPRKRSLTSRAN